MKTQTKEIYKCDFCNKLYQIKSACEKHEQTCSKNPINDRACFHCWALEKRETEIYTGRDSYLDSEPINKKVEYFYCSKKDIFLYTPQNHAKGNYLQTDIEGGVFENYPMPQTCDILQSLLDGDIFS